MRRQIKGDIMTRTFLTAGGEVAAKFTIEGESYRYNGKYGAGCGHISEMEQTIASLKRYHPKKKKKTVTIFK